jgi:hypothetical protein
MKIARPILIACACLSLLSVKSFADPAKATVFIDNQSGRTVVYEYKWGNEPWKVDNLQHGEGVTYSLRYNPKGVPPMHIRFATAPGVSFDEAAKKTYTLDMGWDNRPQSYRFAVRNNNRVDLFPATEARKVVKLAPKSKLGGQKIDDN